MPSYKDLARYRDTPPAHFPEKSAFIARRLRALRHDLRLAIGARRRPDSLIVGSWNLRAFDDGAPRLDESFHYIAEIISNFDVCAIQEVKSDLRPLERLVRFLGPSWDYFVNDVSIHRGGNNERSAFLYNRDKVFFRKRIGEIVLPRGTLPEDEQPARSPFFAAFQSGWFQFTLTTVHIIEGRDANTAAQNRALRAAEITAIGNRLVDLAAEQDEVFFFLGDMNIERPDDEIMQALEGTGMQVPDFGETNLGGTRYFDQIAFTTEGRAERKTRLLGHGRFDWRNAVFGPRQPVGHEQTPDPDWLERMEDAALIDHYERMIQTQRQDHGSPPMADFRSRYQEKTTYEMSDHLPIWVEVETDYSDDYLDSYLPGGMRATPRT
ncbi:MAG: endonuclease/exonuclease/phosphatase family protein [Jannaschia sp.]